MSVDDVLMAVTVYLVHCSEADHLFLRELNVDVENALEACGVERLCP